MPWEIEIAGRLRSLLIDTAIRIAGELRLRAEILANLNRELESSNSELDSFAYVASHDLQEPLRTTSSFVELLQNDYKGKLDEDGNQYLTYIAQASDRMRVLIKDLLEYSRIGKKREIKEAEQHQIRLEFSTNIIAAHKYCIRNVIHTGKGFDCEILYLPRHKDPNDDTFFTRI